MVGSNDREVSCFEPRHRKKFESRNGGGLGNRTGIIQKMKLITLNVWGGKLYDPLISFISQHANDTDIFCFQDTLFGSEPSFSPVKKARLNLHNEIQNVLSGFTSDIYRDGDESYFENENLSPDIGCGQAILVKGTSAKIIESGGFRSHPESTYLRGGDMVSGRCQWVKLRTPDGNLTVMNLHGLWQRSTNKKDTPERLQQSDKIRKFFEGIGHKKIICGDFNLVPDGNAMELLEKDMRNLIKQYGITSTRSKHYPKDEQFADYVLVSEDIEVENFQTEQVEVSDHLPLLIEFK